MGNFQKGKYRSTSTRLNGWDYRQNAVYFVTICSYQKEHFFGRIIAGNKRQFDPNLVDTAAQNFAPLREYLQPTEIGKIAYQYWLRIPEKYPFISLGEFVIMPNHVHGLLSFRRKERLEWQPNQFGPQSQSLGAVIRGYKAGVKSYATKHEIPFAWQRKYYDHIVRDQKAYHQISRYIQLNPIRWKHP